MSPVYLAQRSGRLCHSVLFRHRGAPWDPTFRSGLVPRLRARPAGHRGVRGGGAAAPPSELLYTSPLGAVVTRLRAVSLVSAVGGGLGLPLAVAAAGGGALPSTGVLAAGLTVGAVALGSTVALHYVFHPYVYEVHMIPVRVCSSKVQKDSTDAAATAAVAPSEEPGLQGPCLFKAVSRGLFLGRTETVFDAGRDLAPYRGLRPMCNFTAKGVPLYVHPDQVRSPELRAALHFLTEPPQKQDTAPQDHPDDFI